MVKRKPEVVERFRPWEPRAVVGSEATGEDDGTEAGELHLLGRRRCIEGHRLGDFGSFDPPAHCERSEEIHEQAVALVSPRDSLREIGGEADAVVRRADEAPGERHADGLERPEIEVMTATVTSSEDVSVEARTGSRERLGPEIQESA